MHNWAKTIMECVKTKVDSIGLDNMDEAKLCELEKWSCIAEKIAEFDYYYHITEAMEKPENQYGVNYDENGKFYTPMRSANGRFKRGYDETYDMNPMYYRDMDMRDGRMYYTETGGMNGGNMGGSSNYSGNSTNRGYSENNGSNSSRGYSESRYERARRGYEESKEMNPNSENMEKITEVFEELDKEFKELKPKMTPNEKNHARNKFSAMANSMIQ